MNEKEEWGDISGACESLLKFGNVVTWGNKNFFFFDGLIQGYDDFEITASDIDDFLREDKNKMKKDGSLDDKIEEIIKTILEHCDCEHDYCPPSADCPGHSDASYSIEWGMDKKVKDAIKEILKEEK